MMNKNKVRRIFGRLMPFKYPLQVDPVVVRWLRKVRRIIRRLKPFKGGLAYEVQVGPVVVQFYHKEGRWICDNNYASTVGIGHLRFWNDSHWLH